MILPEGGREANDGGMDYSRTFGREKGKEGKNRWSATHCEAQKGNSGAPLRKSGYDADNKRDNNLQGPTAGHLHRHKGQNGRNRGREAGASCSQ